MGLLEQIVDMALTNVRATAREKRVIREAVQAGNVLVGGDYKAKRVETVEIDATTRQVVITFRK